MILIVRKALLCLVVSFFCGPSIPAQSAAGDIWRRVESPNFELIGNASRSKISAVANRLERFRAAVHKLFLIEGQSRPIKIRVVVFKDSASFRPFKPRLADGMSDDAASGYFQTGEDVDYIAVAADGDLSDIFHEYSHALLARKLGRSDVPTWLNEGLAEYLRSYREIDDSVVEFGATHSRHLKTLQTHQLMPWNKLLRLDNFSLQQSGPVARGLFYAQSWALVQFVVGKKGSTSVNELVEKLSKTQDQSLNKVDDLDLTSVDAGVKDLISEKSILSAIRRLRSELRPVSLMPDELSDAQANAYLGDLLFHLRDEAAESFVLRSLGAEPNLSMANATLGLIRLRQRKFGEAKSLLEKALVSEKTNFLINYYCAFLIARESMDEFGNIERLPAEAARKMRSYLNASISVNAEFADSYRLLAFVGLITDDDLESALNAALRAQSLEPADDECAVLVAKIYARLNKFGEAKQIAEKVFRRSANSYLRKEAAAIITASQDMMAASDAEKRLTVGVTTKEVVKPVILKWRDLTPEQIAKIYEEREINNVNILLDKPAAGESLAVGFIDQVACRDGLINYRFRTADGVLRFFSRNFNDIALKVLTVGTRSFVLDCGAGFPRELTVARFRPSRVPSANAGTLISIAFVPKNFRLKSLEQIAREPLVIIEGKPATNIEENVEISRAERADMDRVMREARITEINERLRQPEASELRMLAVPESLECRDEMMVITARSGNSVQVFHTPIRKNVYVQSLTPDVGLAEFGCRSKLPPITAVFTYVESTAPLGKPYLVAIEFVPKVFELK